MSFIKLPDGGVPQTRGKRHIMKNVTLEELLEAGCHFGHQVTRQNPRARDYIFEARDNINIIDLEKTKEGLDEAQIFVQKLASEGKSMIIVGTKRQAEPIVKQEIARAKKEAPGGLYFVANRWIGGILTNFEEVSKNFKRMKEIDELFGSTQEKAKYTKKELLLFERERNKLESFYGGISELEKLPDALFVIDTHMEYISVREARGMGLKVVGITDTNADPTLVDYAIPANDDAAGSIELITSAIVDAWIDGRKNMGKSEEKEEKSEKKETASNAAVAKETKEPKEKKAPAKKTKKVVEKTEEQNG